MDSSLGKRLYMAGMIIAPLASLFNFQPVWMVSLIILLGAGAGYLLYNPEGVQEFVILYLGFWWVSDAAEELIFVGEWITDIMNGWLAFLAPMLLATLLMWGIKKMVK